jgi:hypothetical protein
MTDKTTQGEARCSRRALIRGGVLTVLAIGLPTRAGAQTKIAPKLVQYQDKPKGTQECDHCLHFIAPSSCKMVSGTINPKGWCALFAAKPK